jgi:hypothetical protein
MRPQEFFTNMPEEVFNMWLAPFVEKIGWPFSDLTSDLSGTRWEILLGHIPLSDWYQSLWLRYDVDWDRIKLNFFTKVTITAVLQHCANGRATGTETIENTKERFWSCVQFIEVHQEIPKPIIALLRNNEIEVVDGNHRIAALLHVGIPAGYRIPMWVPSIPFSSGSTSFGHR